MKNRQEFVLKYQVISKINFYLCILFFQLKIKIIGDIVEIGGGIKSEQRIECGKDQTNEQEVTWGVDSIIKVKPHSKTCASLVISEIELNRNFYVETRLKVKSNNML